MATTKKTTIKETEIADENMAVEDTKPAVKQPKKFAPDDMIPCRSNTFGELLLTGPKTRLLYRWANYGDVTEIPFQDLQALRSTRSSYLFRPRFIIEDEDLVELWAKDFKEMYSNVIMEDMDELFELPVNQFKARLKKAPRGVQQAVKNIAGEKILNGSLDSLAKIKAIDEILGTDLKLYLS